MTAGGLAVLCPRSGTRNWHSFPFPKQHPTHLRAWQEDTPHAKDTDFAFPSIRRGGQEAALCFQLRCPLSASGRKEGRGPHCGRTAFRASNSPPFTQQLTREQGESRAQDRARHPASQQDRNDARSLHAGRQPRDTRSAGHLFKAVGMSTAVS